MVRNVKKASNQREEKTPGTEPRPGTSSQRAGNRGQSLPAPPPLDIGKSPARRPGPEPEGSPSEIQSCSTDSALLSSPRCASIDDTITENDTDSCHTEAGDDGDAAAAMCEHLRDAMLAPSGSQPCSQDSEATWSTQEEEADLFTPVSPSGTVEGGVSLPDSQTTNDQPSEEMATPDDILLQAARSLSKAPRKRKLIKRSHDPIGSESGKYSRARKSPVGNEAAHRRRMTPTRRAFIDKEATVARKASASPRKSAALPRKAAASPRKAAALPRKASASPRKASVSPRKAVALPRKAAASPRKEFASPRKASVSPRKAVALPRKASVSPRKAVALPRKASASPRKAPRKASASPKKTPRKASVAAKMTPRKTRVITKKTSMRAKKTPKKESAAPKKAPTGRRTVKKVGFATKVKKGTPPVQTSRGKAKKVSVVMPEKGRIEGSTDIYRAESILAERKRKNKKEFLVKWEGYTEEESTWEPKSNIQSDVLLKEFYEKKGIPGKGKRGQKLKGVLKNVVHRSETVTDVSLASRSLISSSEATAFASWLNSDSDASSPVFMSNYSPIGTITPVSAHKMYGKRKQDGDAPGQTPKRTKVEDRM